jgi:glycine oxidase
MKSHNIIIIGGGIIGLMSAIELRQSGAEVLLLERGRIGQESSWAGGGILSPMRPWKYPAAGMELIDWSQLHYPELVATIHAASRIDPELVTSGMILFDQNEKVPAEKWGKAYNRQVRFINKAESLQLAPGLHPDLLECVIFLPDINQVRNPRLMKALHHYAIGLGVTVKEETPAQQILIDKKRITGVSTGEEDYHGEIVVVAAGAWSTPLIAPFTQRLEIKPIRGQIILFRSQLNKSYPILINGENYLIPRLDGRILAGSTVEDVGFDKSTTAEAYAELYAAAINLMPCLADCPVELHWAGLRPGSERPLPVIGAASDYEGLYLNIGHYRNGLLLANGSARLLRNLISNSTPIVDPNPYAYIA